MTKIYPRNGTYCWWAVIIRAHDGKGTVLSLWQSLSGEQVKRQQAEVCILTPWTLSSKASWVSKLGFLAPEC